jgi:hypothetical protein
MNYTDRDIGGLKGGVVRAGITHVKNAAGQLEDILEFLV